jgi:hypothetical protein
MSVEFSAGYYTTPIPGDDGYIYLHEAKWINEQNAQVNPSVPIPERRSLGENYSPPSPAFQRPQAFLSSACKKDK